MSEILNNVTGACVLLLLLVSLAGSTLASSTVPPTWPCWDQSYGHNQTCAGRSV